MPETSNVVPRWFFLAAFLSAIVFAQTGELARAAKSDDDTIRIQIGGEPSTLDPSRVIDQYGFGILRNVVEGLYKLDGKGELIKGLAAKHVVSKDGLVHRFTLRADAKWSDGQAVSPEDVVFGFQHTLDPKTAAPNADSFFAIKNAKVVFTGHAKPETLGVRAEGKEVVIELLHPDPLLKLSLTLPAAAPKRRDLYAANKGSWNHKFPVTGSYSIATYRPADQIELLPNPHHPQGKGASKIAYKILSEEITAMNLFEAGRLDVISTITSTEIARLKAQGLVQFVPATTVFYLSFNVTKAPFNDPDWRKAIASSIDREGLSKALHGAFEPTTSYLPKMIDGTLGLPAAQHVKSVERIRALKDKPRVKFMFGASAFTKVVSEKLQHDLKKNLGVELTLEPQELKTLLGKLKTDPPEMYFLGMSAIYDDPINQLSAFSNATSPTFSRYQNSEFEDLVDQIKKIEPGPKRTALAEKANRRLVEEDVVVVPIVLRMQVYGVSKKLQGFQLSPYQVIQLDQLRK